MSFGSPFFGSSAARVVIGGWVYLPGQGGASTFGTGFWRAVASTSLSDQYSRWEGDQMTWALQDAKARFSELARRAERDGPQRVTVRGKPALVVMSAADFDALTQRKKRKPLAELLKKSPVAGLELELTRSRDTGRTVDL
ncbi:MAG: type II toxin-antitoxin system Phd/YefM family antitoxin [Myxococcaceae bacterium]|nr:type II toxin-antitoxin system Phd/YefM family antitoxin [Myxococcaceae bacterium]